MIKNFILFSEKIGKNLVLTFLSLIFLLSFISAGTYDDCNIYGNCKTTTTTTTASVNYSIVNTNNSQFWGGYSWHNMSISFQNWLNGFLYNYNQTYSGSTYNASYVPYSGATTDINLTKRIYFGNSQQSYIGHDGTNLVISANKNQSLTSLPDLSGNRNTGTPQGGVILNGSEGVFDGVNGYVNLTTKINFTSKDKSYTYSGWFKQDTLVTVGTTPTAPIVTDTYNQLRGSGLQINNVSSNLQACFYVRNDSVSSNVCSSNLVLGQWYHVLGTWNNNTNNVSLYINGVLNKTGTGAYFLNNSIATEIGGNRAVSGTNKYFNGSIDEVRIYNTSLSASDISDIYNYGRGHIGFAPTTTGLVAYYDFNGLSDGNIDVRNSSIINVGGILPQSSSVNNFGSSILRWLKGWFVNLDASGNVTVGGLLNTTNSAYIGGNLVVQGNMSIKRPYGMYSSTEDQTLTSANVAYPVSFNWTEDSYQITKEGNSNFTVGQNGDYLIELSLIAQTAVANKNVHIFPQILNTSGSWNNVPRSNTETALRTASSDYVISVSFILDLLTTEKFRIMWGGDDNGIFLNYKTNTTWSPETPSIIMTVSKISESTV